MGLHDDHRKRVRSVYLDKGADALDDARLLELYLFYTNPRADVNPLAVRLLDRFGTLDGVFSADIKDLCNVSGVGENTAVLLNLLKPIYRRAAMSTLNEHQIIKSSDDAAEYLAPYFYGLLHEVVYLLCLSSAGHVLRCIELGSGAVSRAEFSPSDAVSGAVSSHASCVILAHNHVNGETTASDADIAVTKITAEEMSRENILLLDHLIFTGDSSCSLRESGLYHPQMN